MTRSHKVKRQAFTTLKDRASKKGKEGTLPSSYAEAAKGQPSEEHGDWRLAESKKKRRRKAKRPPTTRSGDAIRVSARKGQSQADIIKEVKARVSSAEAGLEVLSIRRTRKEEMLLILRKGGDIPAFQNALDGAIGERAEVRALVTTKTVEVRDLDKTVTKEKVMAAPSEALGIENLGAPCRL